MPAAPPPRRPKSPSGAARSRPSVSQASASSLCAGEPAIGVGAGEDLAVETDADEALRGAAVAAPGAGGFAGELQGVFAGFAFPGAQAVHAAAHLEDVGAGRVEADAPVEAVAAEIHVPTAAALVGVEGVHHLAADVFRVRAGDDAGVGAEDLQAGAVDVLVGDDVVVETLLLQPVDQMRVVAVVEHGAARTEAEQGATGRGDAPAAAVAMGVVGGEADLAVRLDVGVVGREGDEALEHDLGVHLVEAERGVGVGEEGRGAGDEGELGTGPGDVGADEEGDVAFDRGVGRVGRESQGVEAAAPVGGDVDPKCGRPAGVGHVVGMEVDGAVVVGGLGPALGGAVPIGAGHAAGGGLVQGAVETVGGAVVDGAGGDADREIPGGDEGGVGDVGFGEGAHGVGAEGGGVEAGAVDLAVEMAGCRVAVGGEGKVDAVRPGDLGGAGRVHVGAAVAAGLGVEAADDDAELAGQRRCCRRSGPIRAPATRARQPRGTIRRAWRRRIRGGPGRRGRGASRWCRSSGR